MTANQPALIDRPSLAANHGSGLSATRRAHAADRHARVSALRAVLTAMEDPIPPGRDRALELGCGHGHFLTAFAEKHPAIQCLGIDFCRDRIRRAERKLQRAAVANLRFIHAEAGEFLEALPRAMCFRQVFVLFPDPWPKRRHRKNRLVSAGFLDRVTALSAPGCEFFFRSDALDYVAEVRAVVSAHPRWRLQATHDLPFETETVFQARAATFDSLRAVLVS